MNHNETLAPNPYPPTTPRPAFGATPRMRCFTRSGLGRPHATVNYVFTHSPYKLYLYHALIMEEMEKRGYKPDTLWKDPLYRGKAVAPYHSHAAETATSPIYAEHDDAYLDECLEKFKK